jgi:transposase-like protein
MDRTSATFVPPHCPRSRCRYHCNATGWRWIRYGHYTRASDPRVVNRYRCKHCGATFSEQTFSTTYYLKKPGVQEPLLHRLTTCACFRQMARELRCAHSTLVRQAGRVARHCYLVLRDLQAQLAARGVHEPLVIDGFESFAFSQFHPLHLNLVVGAESLFVYGFTHSRLRRKGSMTAKQRRRRAAIEAGHGRPDPKAIELDMASALRMALPVPQAVVVRSDEHPAYPRALRRLDDCEVTHECTPSVQARTFHNPLFPVNRQDLLLRHNSSNHKRETIAFSKRHQAVADRAAVLVLWSSVGKAVSENHDAATPAMKLGLARTPMSPRAILSRRRFRTRAALPPAWAEYYDGKVDTPGIANPRRHTLKLAY